MKPSIETIPDTLVKEIINGRKYYYKNYKKVLKQATTLEAIMGSSELQATIVFIVSFYLANQLDRKTYKIVVSEPGLHLSAKSNYANDIAIYERKALPAGRDKNKYFSVSPLIAVEVDIRIESGEEGSDDFSYMFDKSRQMLLAGSQQVIWVLTQIKSLVVFKSHPQKEVQIEVVSWDIAHPVLPDVQIELGKWLLAEGEDV